MAHPGNERRPHHSTVAVDSNALIQTLADLVSINSVNPAFGGPGESELLEYVEADLRANGIPAVRQEVSPGRWNLVADVAGINKAAKVRPTLLFEAHADTAAIEGMTEPFLPRIDDGKLHGRGACDTKAGLAAMLHAIKIVRPVGPPADIRLAVVADEEYGFLGVRRLVQDLRAVGAVVAEPTHLMPVVASKGVVRWRVNVNGKAAHSSCPQLGVNAITHMARLVGLIEDELQPLLRQRLHASLGTPTITVGTIRGGVQVNMVPDRCTIEIDRRTIPGEAETEVLAEFGRLLDTLRHQMPDIDVELDPPYLSEPPFETDVDCHFVRRCREAIRSITGIDHLKAVPYGSDAGRISRNGIPTVILGPGSIDQAHSGAEYVDIDQVIAAATVYSSIMLADAT